MSDTLHGEWRPVAWQETELGGEIVKHAALDGKTIAICEFVPGEPVRADLLSACEGALAMLDELFPADIFTGESGDRGPVLIAENRARLQAAIEKAKGE